MPPPWHADPPVARVLPNAGPPLEAYRSLRAQGLAPFIFETLGPPGCAIIGFDPAGSIEQTIGKVTARFVRRAGEAARAARGSSALEAVEAVAARLRRPASGPDLAFTGGFAGFFSYEWSAAQEGPDGKREPGVPDAWFGLYDRALVYPPRSMPMLVIDPRVRALEAKEIEAQLSEAGRVASMEMRGDQSRRPEAKQHGRPRLSSDFPRSKFEQAVRRVRAHIRRGDIYQANIAHRTRARGVQPLELYEALRMSNPSPFMGLIDCGGFGIVSGSPERLLRVESGPDGARIASSRPIAGTRPRGRGSVDETMERRLRASVKERAEHTMLVDLERNDLGRVCDWGTVEADELFTVERYSHVMHLVSNVRGRLRGDSSLSEIARAMLPGGTVTGCPKIRAMEIIRDIEPVPRGAYTGSMGYLSFDGRMDLNILIRSAYFPRRSKECHVYAGAGIVQDSRAGREWQETLDKAEALIGALGGPARPGEAWMPPTRIASWAPPRPGKRFVGADVLVIDNYDSFTYNLVQYVAAAGGRVSVVRNDEESLSEMRARRPSHLIISPGPGTAKESGASVAAARAFEGTPILGVCLGLQAIVEAYGGRVAEAPVPVHGKTSVVRRAPPREGPDILSSLPREFPAGRYHSLAAVRVRPPIEVTAVTRDGVVMAVRHRDAPTFGVQFHPESVLTALGMRIIEEFLSLGSPALSGDRLPPAPSSAAPGRPAPRN
jgi:anthranilate synthase/aminodeoxychorismate synthase-like glutamine amidotransferase